MPTNVNYSELDAIILNVRAGGISWGASGSTDLDTSLGEACAAITHRRNVSTTVATSSYNDEFGHTVNHQANLSHAAIHESYELDGFTYDIQTGTASSKVAPFLMIGTIRLAPSALAASVSHKEPTLTSADHEIAMAPATLAGATAFPALAIVDVNAPIKRSWPAGNAVQSGAEAGDVVVSGAAAGTTSQSGAITGSVAQSAAVAGTAVQSGPEAGQESHNA